MCWPGRAFIASDAAGMGAGTPIGSIDDGCAAAEARQLRMADVSKAVVGSMPGNAQLEGRAEGKADEKAEGRGAGKVEGSADGRDAPGKLAPLPPLGGRVDDPTSDADSRSQKLVVGSIGPPLPGRTPAATDDAGMRGPLGGPPLPGRTAPPLGGRDTIPPLAGLSGMLPPLGGLAGGVYRSALGFDMVLVLGSLGSSSALGLHGPLRPMSPPPAPMTCADAMLAAAAAPDCMMPPHDLEGRGMWSCPQTGLPELAPPPQRLYPEMPLVDEGGSLAVRRWPGPPVCVSGGGGLAAVASSGGSIDEEPLRLPGGAAPVAATCREDGELLPRAEGGHAVMGPLAGCAAPGAKAAGKSRSHDCRSILLRPSAKALCGSSSVSCCW